ncbi:pseudouridine synthase [Nonomuraea mangrovi]|uniref:Pseudouridine synthase n=1 Tax=Nonomuraea mangrovi TaxID=2316207 RepID=A0ABW4T6Q4_9ACTN
MINRRSTPSGDGRGRGRTGGSRGTGSRSGGSGRPAYRSDDRRDPRRDDTRGGSRRDDFGGGSRRDDFGGGSRGEGSGGGSRRDDFRGGSGRNDGRSASRDSMRAGSGGARARYGKPQARDERGGGFRDGGSREDRGFRGGDRDDRGFRGDRQDRGFRGGDERGPREERRFGGDRQGAGDRGFRSDRDDRGFRGGERGPRDERDGRGLRGGDREGRAPAGRGFSGDRGSGGRRDERGFRGGDREGRGSGERGFGDRGERGVGGGRDRGFGGGRDREFGGDRGRGFGGADRGFRGERDSRGYQGAGERQERGGFAGRDDRAGLRADRVGKREEGGSRARYGRRDEPRTIGRTTGRPAPKRDDAGRTAKVQTIGGGAKKRDVFKTARQPVRDRDFYPDDYVDERDTTEVPGGVRLQKVLAQAGVASRRACEEMIGDGRVTVNGQVVRRFGAKVDPATQVIHVDGKRIPTAPDLVYYALNKPIGVVSTMEDPQGRPCLADFVQELAPRLFHVGRLDTETEGLLLLTNDGELANRLTHPSYGVQKKYWAKVPGPIPRDLGRRLKKGIELEDGLAKADHFEIVQEHGQQALVEIVLHEGRKHIVRRMLEESGHRVIDLARIEFGPVKLGRTKPGTIRALSLKEVGDLYAAVKL